ncbi:MAG: glycoside hydrolase family 88 protein [Lachnospiraceae bacterium]|nr:glycoside hydrolase family 88 protein [Lachnospiraceae bacterium]
MREFNGRQITDEEAREALGLAVEQVRRNLPLYTNRCQNHSSVNGIYPACENVQWTCGFWPGEIWLAWEYVQNEESGDGEAMKGNVLSREYAQNEEQPEDEEIVRGNALSREYVQNKEQSGDEAAGNGRAIVREYISAEELSKRRCKGDKGAPGDSCVLEYAHGEEFLVAAGKLVESFAHRIEEKIEVDHHDMGFLYTPSCVAAWKLTGDESAKRAALKAADQLMTRFQEKGEFFQAWGNIGEPGAYRFIIDCLMNLPLLYWASETTRDPRYQDAARRHITTCMRYSFRDDGSTYHTFFMNQDGTPARGETCQGFRDDSFWARGQAWGVYGSVQSYRYDPRPEYLTAFHRALDFYLSRLPEDLVPYWDMIFSDGSGEPRDSSSAAIVACGLLEARRYLPEAEAGKCEALARQMLYSLTKNYTVWGQQCLRGEDGQKLDFIPGAGLLLHGTYSKKSLYNTCTEEGVDEYTSWGDYFYMEALTRLTRDWKSYW